TQRPRRAPKPSEAISRIQISTLEPVPAAIRPDVGVREPVVVRQVDADAALPVEIAPELVLDLERRERLLLALGHDAKIDRVPERVLRVARDVMAFFPQHFVELPAPVAAHD